MSSEWRIHNQLLNFLLLYLNTLLHILLPIMHKVRQMLKFFVDLSPKRLLRLLHLFELVNNWLNGHKIWTSNVFQYVIINFKVVKDFIYRTFGINFFFTSVWRPTFFMLSLSRLWCILAWRTWWNRLFLWFCFLFSSLIHQWLWCVFPPVMSVFINFIKLN